MFRWGPFFFIVVQYLHDTLRGAKGVSFFIKVFCETGCVAIASECFLVLLEPRSEAPSSLSDTYALLQSRQVSLYTPDSENLSGVGFLCDSRFPIVFLVRIAIFNPVFLKRLVM